ncbi:FAAH [Symbiodinium natans]|uniref:FAAH protein n=1 Tax=Symbiodinium natans TaxID=878477 RepID=A0A812MJY8_9DINO|nr:FAAH [Symbiodinium natans]
MASILALDIEELAAAIRERRFSALEVLRTYRARAEEIHHACNAVAYWLPDAEREARQADEHLQRTGEVLGPLHGVPFTVKDHIAVAGTPLTVGTLTLKRRGLRSEQDDNLVATLRALGAFPFAKSTMAQLGMSIGGGSPVHGDTLNPWDTRRTCGGSSSGEGALIGGGASPFGIGSDVGGSVRIPSAYCGISALKPTVGRLSIDFVRGGEYFTPIVLGLMARSAKDLAMLHSLLLSDIRLCKAPRLVPLSFDSLEFLSKRKLRIGHFSEEFTFPRPCPAVRRALREAALAFEGLGHEVVPFAPHSGGIVTRDMYWDLNTSFYISAGPYEDSPSSESNPREGRNHDHIRRLVMPSWTDDDEPVHPDAAASATGPYEKWSSVDIQHAGALRGSCLGYERIMHRRDVLRDRFYEAWQKARLDVLVCPVYPTPAPHVEEVRNTVQTTISTRIFNVLDMPAGAVTVTTVQDADLKEPYDAGIENPHISRMVTRAVQDSLGLPVALQLVALPWREELCLRAMCELERVMPVQGSFHSLRPVPRRSPTLGAAPEMLSKSRL